MTKTYFVQYYINSNRDIKSTIIDVDCKGTAFPLKLDIESALDLYGIPINNITNISLLN